MGRVVLFPKAAMKSFLNLNKSSNYAFIHYSKQACKCPHRLEKKEAGTTKELRQATLGFAIQGVLPISKALKTVVELSVS